MTKDHTGTNSAKARPSGTSAGSVASDIKSATTRKFDNVAQGVRSHADDAETEAASEVDDVASAPRRAADEMRGGSAQERALGQIASSLADASDAIRDKDLGEISQDINKVARDIPILFLGGAALLGFAASRYAKATGERSTPSGTSQAMTAQRQVTDFVDEGNPNTQAVGTHAIRGKT